MKRLIVLIIFLVCISSVSATQIKTSKSDITLGEELTITVTPSQAGTYKYVNVFSGHRKFDHIKTTSLIFNLNQERFSPLLDRVVTYRPTRAGTITFKAYDFGSRTWAETSVTVNDVAYNKQFVCSRIRRISVRGECQPDLCSKRGYEHFACVKEGAYARHLCKQVREPDCDQQCPKTYRLEEVKQCG